VFLLTCIKFKKYIDLFILKGTFWINSNGIFATDAIKTSLHSHCKSLEKLESQSLSNYVAFNLYSKASKKKKMVAT